MVSLTIKESTVVMLFRRRMEEAQIYITIKEEGRVIAGTGKFLKHSNVKGQAECCGQCSHRNEFSGFWVCR
jgi:hypothetical protein